MTCVSIALLNRVDERLKSRMDESSVLRDHLIGKAGADFLLATTDRRVSFEGVSPLQIELEERHSEDLIALIGEREVDFSPHAYRIYADPYNTPSLVDDSRIGDGFIIKAGEAYDSPEDNLRLLRALKMGSRIKSVHRRSGEPSAVMDDRILLARSGPYHPKTDEILRPFKVKAGGAVKLHTLSFNIKDAKIMVDNTFKPKTVKMKRE